MANTHHSTGPSVVVGVDGSAPSRHALRWAAHFAALAGTTVEVVTTWQYPSNYGWSAVPSDWSPAADMHKVATDAVDEVFGTDRPADLEITVCEGHPATVLLERSRTAQMLVVGSRGHGGFAGLLLGAVSAAVAEHAHCPVLVVHGETDPPGRVS